MPVEQPLAHSVLMHNLLHNHDKNFPTPTTPSHEPIVSSSKVEQIYTTFSTK